MVIVPSLTVPEHTAPQHPPTPRHEGGVAGHLVRVARQEARKQHLAPARARQNIPARMPSQQPPPFTLESKPTRSAHQGQCRKQPLFWLTTHLLLCFAEGEVPVGKCTFQLKIARFRRQSGDFCQKFACGAREATKSFAQSPCVHSFLSRIVQCGA